MSNEVSEISEKLNKNDSELDITSDKFNPLKALYSKELDLPVKDVKPLDNLGIFLSRLKNAGNDLGSQVNK